MSDPQQKIQKKNKKKKKPSSNGTVVNSENSADKQTVKDSPKLEPAITEVLPVKVGMTTKVKDVEVTMVNNGNDVANGTLKKKKKKKKKQKPVENAGETSSNETENQNLLNFKENHIELVNHPEISVTLSTAPIVQVEEPKCEEKVTKISEKEEPTNSASTSSNAKKKKKKKKKKAAENESSKASSAPVESTEDSPSTPTYVKLPADGGNCVLLVSHESFSTANNPIPDNPNSKSQSKSSTVVLKKNEPEKIVTNAPQTNANIQNESSVSIFPVYSDSNNKLEKNPEFNVNSSLNKISNLIINDNDELKCKSSNISGDADSSVANEEDNKPTKAQLKAERRAKQEAQRAAKLAKSSEKDSLPQTNEQKKVVTKSNEQPSIQKITSSNDSTLIKDTPKVHAEQEIVRKVQIFSHLPQYQDLLSKRNSYNKSKIPSAILELGSHYSKGTLFGSNARCVGLLAALRQVILDYNTPSDKVLSKDLELKFQSYLEYLNYCRPVSVSMINAMKFLKHQINHVPEHMTDNEAKENLCKAINDYVGEEILLAKEAITISASAKIVNNDTILVFAYSSLVKDVLCKAHDQNKKFCVIVVDSRAKLEGLQMLRRLVNYGIRCSYISINAVSSVIKTVNKVIIGAHALLANGYVMSRLGCKILSLVGSTYSVPVLVCCETYKFCERTLTDSIVNNELGNPNDLISMSAYKKDCLLKWHDSSSLQIYNLLYDVTPSDFVSVVITEKGLIPCTSVPVLLRVKHAGLQE